MSFTWNDSCTEIERLRTTGPETAFGALVERYRLLVRYLPALLFEVADDGQILTANELAVRVTGHALDEMQGKDFWSLLFPGELAADAARLRQALADPSPGEFSVRLAARDGARWQLAMTFVRNACRSTHPACTLFLGRATSAVEATRLQPYQGAGAPLPGGPGLGEQLRQAQKLEAIGRLASGIAHDFNNILTVILGYSDILLNTFPLPEPAQELVREVRQSGQRAAALTHQLLAFSRNQVLNPAVLDGNVLIREMEKMLVRMIGEDVSLHVATDPNLGRVRADPGQLEQVVMNLVLNARDAMPTGGSITIETRNVELDEAYAATHAEVKPGPYVVLSVSDTGAGIDAATRERIFEPFFTTKEKGRGTGLGLATVYGIVKQSGGHIAVYSELGRGTTFKVYLPALALPASVAPPATVTIPPGTETVLLAEDEESVRRLARLTLESAGYRVFDAADAGAALSLCRQDDPVHLLVTDVVMPRMSGRELADAARTILPDLKVLYCSGYTDDAVVRHGILSDEMPFLQKPFTPTALARKVREVLDS